MDDEAGPVARALITLAAIQSAPGISGARLAGRLGVSDRAARRSVAVLRKAGIPVESTSGRYGGYRLGRGARLPPLMFSSSEALGLVMAVLQGWHGSVDDHHPAASALTKILAALPPASAGPAEAFRQVRAQNPNDVAAMPNAELTATIAQACADHICLELSYRGGNRMSIEPWAVVVRHGRWYLLGWLPAVDARRVLRLDRINAVEITTRTCRPPTDLDAVREVEDHLADGWSHLVEVRIDAPASRMVRCLPRALGRIEAIDESTCLLRGSTDEPLWYAEHLAAIPASFTVSGDAEVRAAVELIGRRLIAATDPRAARPQ